MDQSKEIRPWWNKLERDDFNGMAARKSYDQLASEVKAKDPEIDIKELSKTVLRKENEYQAKSQAQRLSAEVKSDAAEVAAALRGLSSTGAVSDYEGAKLSKSQKNNVEDPDKMAERIKGELEADITKQKAAKQAVEKQNQSEQNKLA